MTTKNSSAPKSKTSKYKKKRSLTPWLIGLGVALLILIPVGINIYRQAQLPGERFASLGNVHINQGAATPNYNSSPPTSGPHYPNLANWGSYTEELPDPSLIHNMEDAGVILWYRMGTPEENRAQVAALEGAYNAARYRRVVIAPREDLETQYAMTAWQRKTQESADENDARQHT